MAELVRTDDIITEPELRDLLDFDSGEEVDRSESIAVCAGEWRHEVGDKWRLWRDPSFESD